MNKETITNRVAIVEWECEEFPQDGQHNHLQHEQRDKLRELEKRAFVLILVGCVGRRGNNCKDYDRHELKRKMNE